MTDTRRVGHTLTTYTFTSMPASFLPGTWSSTSRHQAAKWMRSLSSVGESFTVSVTSRNVYADAEMCYGCQAREALWDMDCDGAYSTVACGVCDWWACVEARDAERVRACRHKSPQHDKYVAAGTGHNCYAVIPR